jgi:hypothetical protein
MCPKPVSSLARMFAMTIGNGLFACILPVGAAQGEKPETSIDERLIGEWRVAKQTLPKSPLVQEERILRFVTLSFDGTACVLTYQEAGAKVDTKVQFKTKSEKGRTQSELYLINDDDVIKFRLLYRWLDSGDLEIAVGLSDKEAPKGFDPTKSKVVLLECVRTKKK